MESGPAKLTAWRQKVSLLQKDACAHFSNALDLLPTHLALSHSSTTEVSEAKAASVFLRSPLDAAKRMRVARLGLPDELLLLYVSFVSMLSVISTKALLPLLDDLWADVLEHRKSAELRQSLVRDVAVFQRQLREMEKLNGEFFLKQQHLNSLSEKARDDMRLAEEEQRRLRTASRRQAEDKIKMAREVGSWTVHLLRSLL